MPYRDIRYSVADGIATIVFARPDTQNAMGGALSDEFAEAMVAARDDDDVRVVLVTGEGRYFSIGAAPRDLAAGSERPAPSQRGGFRAMGGIIRSLDKPYIAAINGAAVGGGLDQACQADIRIASDRAKFGVGYLRMGVIPGGGGCYLLPRIVGLARALELIWTSKIIGAEEALQIGLVNRVVPHDDLMDTSREFAVALAQGPTLAIRTAKRLVYSGLHWDEEIAQTETERAFAIVSHTADAVEGPRAFVEKREPEFRGS